MEASREQVEKLSYLGKFAVADNRFDKTIVQSRSDLKLRILHKITLYSTFEKYSRSSFSYLNDCKKALKEGSGYNAKLIIHPNNRPITRPVISSHSARSLASRPASL